MLHSAGWKERTLASVGTPESLCIVISVTRVPRTRVALPKAEKGVSVNDAQGGSRDDRCAARSHPTTQAALTWSVEIILDLNEYAMIAQRSGLCRPIGFDTSQRVGSQRSS